jgi:hypothetical protein
MIRTSVVVLLLTTTLVGCGDKDGGDAPDPEDDSGTEADADTDADTDSDTDADTDSDADTDTSADSDSSPDSPVDTDTDLGDHIDDDGDGFSEDDGDCDDAEPTATPGGEEMCGDGVDNDCDGTSNGCAPTGEFEVEDVASAVFDGLIKYAYIGHGLDAGDIDGDGLSDLVFMWRYDDVTVNNFRPAWAWLGSATGNTTADLTNLGIFVSNALPLGGLEIADVNGDGYDDLFVAMRGPDGDNGAGLIYGPWTTKWDSSDVVAFIRTPRYISAPHVIRSGFDSDGDGVAEVLVGEQFDEYGFKYEGAIGVFENPTGIYELEDGMLLLGTDGGADLGKVVAVIDVDGDGLDDLALGLPEIRRSTGHDGEGLVRVVMGGITGVVAYEDAYSAQIHGVLEEASLGETVEAVPDANGDGYGDLIMGSPHLDTYYDDGAMALVLGSATGMPTGKWSDVNTAYVGGMPTTTASTDLTATMEGDLDGDGALDLVIGTPYTNVGEGDVTVYYGPLAGYIDQSDADLLIDGPRSKHYLGTTLTVLPDRDSSGHDEIAFTSVDDGSESEAGILWVFAGEGL